MADILPIVMNNTTYEWLAVIDDYKSLIWTTRYSEVGDFELVVPVRSDYLNLFKQDYFIIREDDENVGVIEDIVLQTDEDNKNVMIISGRFLASVIGRRIIAKQTTVTGDVMNNIRSLIRKNCVLNFITEQAQTRTLPRFQVEGIETYGDTFTAQFTGENLLDVVSALCDEYGIGFKCILGSGLSGTYLKFLLYTGTDRSYDQSDNPVVIFSDEYDNLMSAEYEEFYQNKVNAVLVAGEGEGLSRKTAWSVDGDDPSGYGRYEKYLDQRNIRSDEEMTEEEYTEILQEAGKEEITSYTVAFTGIATFGQYKYKQDVNVGDLVVVQYKSWGISLKARLMEVIESVDETGRHTIMPTFGV